jgi:hypothetical protein
MQVPACLLVSWQLLVWHLSAFLSIWNSCVSFISTFSIISAMGLVTMGLDFLSFCLCVLHILWQLFKWTLPGASLASVLSMKYKKIHPKRSLPKTFWFWLADWLKCTLQAVTFQILRYAKIPRYVRVWQKQKQICEMMCTSNQSFLLLVEQKTMR